MSGDGVGLDAIYGGRLQRAALGGGHCDGSCPTSETAKTGGASGF